VCEFSCHNFIHQRHHCNKKCQRILPCNHRCLRNCKEDCDLCLTIVEKEFKCGHKIETYCSTKLENIYCKFKIIMKLDCGHEASVECYTKNSPIYCSVELKAELECGHIQKVYCYRFKEQEYCNEPCKAILTCGHICQGKCGDCLNNTLHIPCRNVCGRIMPCSHECKLNCGQPCLCNKKCENVCEHGKCVDSCSSECVPCVEECKVKCIHSSCTKLCNEMCNFKCELRCEKILECQHQCIGLCGEECPNLCRICDPQNKIFTIFFGYEDDLHSLFFKLDCGHIFELRGLDEYMGLTKDDYSVNAKTCLYCRKPILRAFRYKNKVKSTFNLIQKLKTNYLKQYGGFQEIYSKTKELISEIKREHPDYKSYSINLLFEQCLNITKQDLPKLVSGYNLCNLSKEFYHIEKYFRSEKKQPLYEGKLKWIFFYNYKKLLSYFTNLNSYSKTFIDYLKRKVTTLYLFTQIIDKEYLHIYLDILVSSYLMLSEDDISKLNKIIPGISKKQMLEIMSIAGGNWYTCPNGHLYSIGECGRPMEASNCPECNQLIGGRDHNPHANNNLFRGF
jgi:hypothetical protein